MANPEKKSNFRKVSDYVATPVGGGIALASGVAIPWVAAGMIADWKVINPFVDKKFQSVKSNVGEKMRNLNPIERFGSKNNQKTLYKAQSTT